MYFKFVKTVTIKVKLIARAIIFSIVNQWENQLLKHQREIFRVKKQVLLKIKTYLQISVMLHPKTKSDLKIRLMIK